MKKTIKLVFIVLVITLLGIIGTLNVYADNEEGVDEAEQINATPVDTVAPVFNPNIQTRYTVKKEEGAIFNPDEVITDITATDNVDGKNVVISLAYNGVNLSQEGEYQVMYTATDKAGNVSYIIIVVNVDGLAPEFDKDIENLYYMNKNGVIYDSKHNVVEALPKTLIAKEALGAYKGIGVYITTDEKGNVFCIDMIKDTPAENNLIVNDIIIGVDGEDVRGKTSEYIASIIKGEEGTTVQLDLIRNEKEISLTIERKLIKLHGEIDIIANPNIDINSIDKAKSGTIEIKYIATDEVGNTSEFIITVIVIDEETLDQFKNEKAEVKSEETDKITTSGNPPESVDLENPVVKDNKEVIENDENKTEVEKDDKEVEKTIEDEQVKVEEKEESEDAIRIEENKE